MVAGKYVNVSEAEHHKSDNVADVISNLPYNQAWADLQETQLAQDA